MFNGSGVFLRLYSWTNDVLAGIKIRADRMDNEFNGIAVALTDCVTRDGQSPAMANLPMAGYRHTNVANAQNPNEYATLSQVLNNSGWLGTASGTADNITFTPAVPITSYTPGIYGFLVATSNTSGSPVTLNINSLGAKNLRKQTGGGLTNLASYDLMAGSIALVEYDGTQFQLLNIRAFSQGGGIASAATLNLDSISGDSASVSGTTTISSITLTMGRQFTTKFDSSLVLTNSSSLILPTGANITTAAGDVAVWRAESASVVRCISYLRADGTPVGGASYKVATFTRDTSLGSGTQDITVGFTPKAVIFLSNINTGSPMSVGVSDGISAGCIADLNAIIASAYTVGGFSVYLVQSGTANYTATTSIISNGFRMTWSATGSNTGTATMTYLALR